MNVSGEFTGRVMLSIKRCETSGTVPYKRELMKVYLRSAALNTGTVVNGRDH
jgi:hypothetical protein